MMRIFLLAFVVGFIVTFVGAFAGVRWAARNRVKQERRAQAAAVQVIGEMRSAVALHAAFSKGLGDHNTDKYPIADAELLSAWAEELEKGIR